MDESKSKQLPTNSLDRALVVLQFIARTPGGMTNLEVSKEFNIARSSCTYILSRLEKQGFLDRDKQTGKYTIGLKNLVLAKHGLREAGFRAASEPTLYRLAAITGLAANLGVLQSHRVILLDRVEGPTFVKAAIGQSSEHLVRTRSHHDLSADYLRKEQRDIGSEIPVYTTAMGKVLLAHLPAEELRSFVDKFPPGKNVTVKGEPQPLLRELEQIREQGYSLVEFETHNESCALAAPIFDATNTLRASVSVSCRRHLPVWNDVQALSELVKGAAWEISCRLNYPKLLTEDRLHLIPSRNKEEESRRPS